MMYSLSIVIPAYNEARRLEKTLPEVLHYLNQQKDEQLELLLIDDGSTDKTAEVADSIFNAAGPHITTHVLRSLRNFGKGHAVRKGLLASRSPVALFTDADLSTPLSEMPKLLAPIRSGRYDIAIASRIGHDLIGKPQPWRREKAGRIFNFVVRGMTGIPAADTQCGFKAFNLTTCRPIIEAAQIDGFAFDVELLYLAHLADLKLIDCQVRWDHHEGSKVSFFKDSLGMFKQVVSLRRRARRGFYDKAVRVARHHAAIHHAAFRAAS
jgi:dolichyl-phosphate beta-glucosyltransferase